MGAGGEGEVPGLVAARNAQQRAFRNLNGPAQGKGSAGVRGIMPTLTLEFDGTLKPLLDYLRHIDGCQDEVVPNKERLLLKVGRQFHPDALTAAECAVVEQAAKLAGAELGGFPRKKCFGNSQKLAAFDMSGGLTYVEGYVCLNGGIPVHHAWVSLEGKVIDVTLRDRETGEPIIGMFEGRVYYGIPFLTASWRARALGNGSLCALLEHLELLGVDEGGVGDSVVTPGTVTDIHVGAAEPGLARRP